MRSRAVPDTPKEALMSPEIVLIVKHIAITTIVAMPCLMVLFFPLTASDGKKSRTLTGLMCTTCLVFFIVVLDTVQDRPSPVETMASVKSQSTDTKKGSRRKYSSKVPAGGVVRAVLKEKYSILFALWFGFSFLYLLSHKGERTARMVVGMVMALRGKHHPYAHQDPMDDFIVNEVLRGIVPGSKGGDYLHEWFLRALLAKQGNASSLDGQGADVEEPSTEVTSDIPMPAGEEP